MWNMRHSIVPFSFLTTFIPLCLYIFVYDYDTIMMRFFIYLLL
jgi:hypothetical protein